MTQDDLAQLSKVSRRGILAYEQGDFGESGPSLESVMALAKALDWSVGKLLGEEPVSGTRHDDGMPELRHTRDSEVVRQALHDLKIQMQSIAGQARAALQQIDFHEQNLCGRPPHPSTASSSGASEEAETAILEAETVVHRAHEERRLLRRAGEPSDETSATSRDISRGPKGPRPSSQGRAPT